jgi:hypothetical protein
VRGADISRIIPLAALLVAAVICCGVLVAAHRFARRRQREGAWNADGPIHPSEPPPGWGGIPGYLAERPTIEPEDDDDLDESR